MPTIQNEKVLFNNRFIIEEAEIRTGKAAYTRMRLKKQEASAVLVYNKDKKVLVLTKQFRYAIHEKNSENLLEIVAGVLDGDETPLDAAIRETAEEIGYLANKNNLEFICSYFSSPGFTSEQMHLYYTEVTNADKINEGGGLENENESIDVIEMKVDEFLKQVYNGNVVDAKTLIAGLWLTNKKYTK